MTHTLPGGLEEIAIAKAKEEEVLALIAAQAQLLEEKKAEARAAAKAAGKTDAEISDLIPQYPAGAFGI